MSDDYLERLERHLGAYREDDDSECIDNPVAYRWLTVGDQRAAVAELKRLRAERLPRQPECFPEAPAGSWTPNEVPEPLVSALLSTLGWINYADARRGLAAVLTQLGLQEEWRAESDLGHSALPPVYPFTTKEAAEQALTQCRSFGLPARLRRRYVTDWEDR